MKRDLNLEGFAVLGSIMDCVALRKLVPYYRSTNRKLDKILKYPLINLFDGALYYCVLFCLSQDRKRKPDVYDKDGPPQARKNLP